MKVAPREITDIVYRASRVLGCSASVADHIAEEVTRTEVDSGEGLRKFLQLADHGAVDVAGDLGSEDDGGRRSLERERAALAFGVDVDSDLWARIERIAVNFLLAEHILDA